MSNANLAWFDLEPFTTPIDTDHCRVNAFAGSAAKSTTAQRTTTNALRPKLKTSANLLV